MTDTITFMRTDGSQLKSDKYGAIRISPDLHDQLENISNTTGRSVSSVAAAMIEFALMHTEVNDACGAVRNNCNSCPLL